MNAQLNAVDESPSLLCFHCHEPIPSGKIIYATIKQCSEPMCCEGCRAVAELIATVGLQDYYQYRSEPALKPIASANDEWQAYTQEKIAAQYTRAESAERSSAVVLVDGVRCAACAWLIERMLRRIAGVCDVSVNVATGRARVVWLTTQTSFAEVLRTLASLGYRPYPIDAHSSQQQARDERRDMLKRLGVSGVGMMQVMMYVLPMYVHSDMDASVRHYLQLVSLLLTTPVLFYAGWPFLANAARALRLRSMNMDVPVAIALLLAYSASVYNTFQQNGAVYFDSVSMFVFLLTLGRFIAMLLRQRNNSVTDALLRIQPRIAHRLDSDGITDVMLAQLASNDVVLVRVGEIIPADGIIISGASSIDESLLTGESLPVNRSNGEHVMCGSINVAAPLQVRITALGQTTVLAGVLALLQRVQADKPRVAQMADRAARWFLHAMLIITSLVAITWWLIDPSHVFNTVLAVLVVTCPCALSLATPAVIAATTTALARRGLLITHADAIEELARIDIMAFDKTGTLTTGKITVVSTTTFSILNASECLAIAAALEQAADHPIARAFTSVSSVQLPVSELKVIAGAGIDGIVDGVRYRLGSAAFVAGLSTLAAKSDSAAIWLGNIHSTLAYFELQDTLRPDAFLAVQQLQQLGVRTTLLSGDATTTVTRIASECGIADYRSRQSPADKVTTLQCYQRDKHSVAMVGDGINDAPVLSAASVSIAMGAGTALAQASADAVLMNNSLQVLPHALRIARQARRIMRQNLWWATIYNLCAVPLAAMGWVSPWLAAAGMSLSSVLVVLNATRVLQVASLQPTIKRSATSHGSLQLGIAT